MRISRNVNKYVKRGILVVLLLGPGLTALAKDPFRPSVKEQIHLGEEVASEIRRELHVLPASDPRVKLLRRVGRRMLSTFPASETWQYSFDVIDSKDVNAFALPGGPTFFYTGLLDRLKTEDEIAGIMGHELTHVRQQHWARIYGDSQKRNLLLTGAFLLLKVNYTGTQIADLVNNLLVLKYSRGDEAAADEGGFVNSTAAGYNPQGLADAFAMLDKMGGQGPEFLSDHPNDNKRIQHIEDDIKKSGKSYPAQRPLPWPAKEDPPKAK